jgi:hypothetical protein
MTKSAHILILACLAVAGAARAQIPDPPASPLPLPPSTVATEVEDGKVVLDCLGDADGKLSDCKVVSETPADQNFGQIALSMIQLGFTRRKPETPGGRVQLALTFPKQAGAAGEHRRLAPGATPVAAETAGPGEPIVTFPYVFRRTGVLTQDVTGYSIMVRGVLAPAGSVGFYAGSFSAQTIDSRDVWCFLPPPDAAKTKTLCLMPGPKWAAILPKVDPYDIVSFNGYSPNYANLPVFEEKPVQIPGDLRLEYRFAGWKGDDALVVRWVNGRKSETSRLRKAPDGHVRLHTLAGDYRLDPAPGDPARAKITPPPVSAKTGAAPP